MKRPVKLVFLVSGTIKQLDKKVECVLVVVELLYFTISVKKNVFLYLPFFMKNFRFSHKILICIH